MAGFRHLGLIFTARSHEHRVQHHGAVPVPSAYQNKETPVRRYYLLSFVRGVLTMEITARQLLLTALRTIIQDENVIAIVTIALVVMTYGIVVM